MCGLFASTGVDINQQLFLNSLDTLTHRGPDNTSHFFGPGFALGHTRLSIIDTNNCSNQPFFSSDGLHAIVYNGELFNYKDLAVSYNLNL